MEAQSRVCDVYLVESYKKYNADTSQFENAYCKCVSKTGEAVLEESEALTLVLVESVHANVRNLLMKKDPF